MSGLSQTVHQVITKEFLPHQLRRPLKDFFWWAFALFSFCLSTVPLTTSMQLELVQNTTDFVLGFFLPRIPRPHCSAGFELTPNLTLCFRIAWKRLEEGGIMLDLLIAASATNRLQISTLHLNWTDLKINAKKSFFAFRIQYNKYLPNM